MSEHQLDTFLRNPNCNLGELLGRAARERRAVFVTERLIFEARDERGQYQGEYLADVRVPGVWHAYVVDLCDLEGWTDIPLEVIDISPSVAMVIDRNEGYHGCFCDFEIGQACGTCEESGKEATV
jgi:hypothetical protein